MKMWNFYTKFILKIVYWKSWYKSFNELLFYYFIIFYGSFFIMRNCIYIYIVRSRQKKNKKYCILIYTYISLSAIKEIGFGRIEPFRPLSTTANFGSYINPSIVVHNFQLQLRNLLLSTRHVPSRNIIKGHRRPCIYNATYHDCIITLNKYGT